MTCTTTQRYSRSKLRLSYNHLYHVLDQFAGIMHVDSDPKYMVLGETTLLSTLLDGYKFEVQK